MTGNTDPLQTFRDRLPWHGYATDNLQYGLRFLPVALAATKALVQYQARHSIAWLAYDIDDPLARFRWTDKLLPAPNIVALNQQNGHAHFFYALETPVHDYAKARPKPLRYLAAVDIALTLALEADPGFAKLIAKNPLRADRWEVIVPRETAYTLDELADYVDLGVLKDGRRKIPLIGYGRNVTLFHALRRWAYRERRNSYLNEDLFAYQVRARAMALNADFPVPLPHNEVRHTAKSVSKWTWRRMSDEGFRRWQSNNGKRSGIVRRGKAAELRDRIVETAREYPDFTQSDVAALCGCTRETVNRYLGSVTRTISDKGSSPTLPLSKTSPPGSPPKVRRKRTVWVKMEIEE